MIRPSLLATTGIAAVICALLAQHPADPQQVPAGVIAASLLAILGAAIAFPDPTSAGVNTVVPCSERVRDMASLAAILALPTLVAVAFWSREQFSRTNSFVLTSSTWAALLWVAGIVAGLLFALPHKRRGSLAERLRSPWLLLEVVALIVIFDVAAGLRLYHLSSLPEGVWFDEVDFANSAQLLRSMTFQPFGAFNVGHNPSLYFYVMALLLKLGGMTIGTVRLTSVLFGLLAVLAVYGLGRRAGGAPLGLTAAAFLAIGQWAIDFSRFGMSNIAAPATIALGFLALAVGMHRPRAFWFALSGTILGLSLLTYAGGFLAGAGVALGVVAIRLVIEPAFRRAAWPAVLFLPLGLLVGAAPFLTMLGLDSDYTLARERTVSIFTEYTNRAAQIAAIKANLRAHLLMFTVAGDNNGRHNLPGAPMLDAVTGACFLLGLGICLRRLHHWFYLLLIAWLGASMLGGILSLDFEAPQGARTVGAIAPIALIAALPLALLARGIWQAVPRVPGWWAARRDGVQHAGPPRTGSRDASRTQAIAALLATVAVVAPLSIAYARDTDQYFVKQAANMGSWSAMDGQQAIMGRAAAALARQGYTVRISPSLAGDPTVVFTSGGLNIPAFDTGTPVELPVPAGGLALLIPVDDAEVLDYVHRSFPTARILPLTPNFDHTLVQANAVLILPADAQRNLGATVSFVGGGRSQTVEHVQGPIAWPAQSGRASEVTIRGTLLLSSAQAWRPVTFRASGARKATITIDGHTWKRAESGSPSVKLGAGNHQLVVQAQGQTGPALALEWNPVSVGQGWQPLPAQMLAAPSMPTGGLLGLYFNGPTIGTQPVLARVDQTVDTYYQNAPIPGGWPFAVRWLGTLQIAQGGTYGFRLDSTGPSQLYIDGHLVASAPGNGTASTNTVALASGPHSLQLDYSATGSYLHCYLTWAPPGQSFAPIPPAFTQPAHG